MEGRRERNDAAKRKCISLQPPGGLQRRECLSKQAEGDVIDREPKVLDPEKKRTQEPRCPSLSDGIPLPCL
jgi:hypothetical protein